MRADYGPNRLSLRLAFRPFADAFEFQGRSTRHEVISFWLLGALGHLGTLKVEGISSQTAAVFGIAWAILWGWPWTPLLARRLHDQGRSGRWAVLPFVGAAMLLLNWWLAPTGNGPPMDFSLGSPHLHRSIAWTPLTIGSFAAFGMISIVTFLFYLLPNTKGPNRYGPDPRLAAEPPLIPAET